MAFPGTPAEVTQIFQIFGIPQGGSAFVVGRIVSLYGPAGNVYDFTAVCTQLNSLLSTITATQYANIQTQLAEWTNITDYSELTVSSDQTTRGQLADHYKRRRNIRMTLSNIIGFFCPLEGFFSDASSTFAGAQGGGRMLR